MKIRNAISGIVALCASPALADINLEFRPDSSTVNVGETVNVGVYAVSDSGSDQLMALTRVVFSWENNYLRLIGNDNSGAAVLWSSEFTANDPYNLNEVVPPQDGDGLYKATANPGSPVPATPEGTLLTTLQFEALAARAGSPLVILESGGDPQGTTIVYDGTIPGLVVTGTLTGAEIVVASGAEAFFILEATPRQAEPGSIIEVDTKIATDVEIAGFQFTVEYHDQILNFVDATLGADLVGTSFAVTNVVEDIAPVTEPGTNRSVLVQVLGSGVESFSGSDTKVARLRFQLTANEGTSPLVFNSTVCQVTHMATLDLRTLCPDDLAFQGEEITSDSGSPPLGNPHATVVWRKAAKTALWLMDGTAVLPQSGLLARMNSNWIVAGTGDFNGDGHTDILWRHRLDGRNHLWLLDETTVLPGSGPLPTLANRRWVVAATADFNGDGTTDILWRHTTKGKNSVWLLDGTTVLPASGRLPTLADRDWIVAGAGDFDGDGLADVFWRHLGDGSNAMWLLDGTTVRPGSGSVQAITNPRWSVAATGDFDSDGQADILWRHRRTGRNSLWFMNGTTVLPASGALPAVDEAGWVIAGAADFDGDGYTDVLWRDVETGDNLIWFMDGTLGMPFAGSTNSVSPAWTMVGIDD